MVIIGSLVSYIYMCHTCHSVIYRYFSNNKGLKDNHPQCYYYIIPFRYYYYRNYYDVINEIL